MSIFNSQFCYLTILGRTFFYLTTGHRQISIPNCISTAAPCTKKSGDPISPSSALPAVSSRCWCASLSCIYAPCHVLSLPKSCRQLRSQLRSAGVDGAVAQRAGAHYFCFLTEAVNHFCSDVHPHPLMSPARDQTTDVKQGRRDLRNFRLLSFIAYCRNRNFIYCPELLP